VNGQGREANPLTAAVDRARRRCRANQALAEATLAAAVTVAGLALLLLLGRTWFPAPLVAGIALGGVAAAGWRWWRARPSSYRVSQILDARLHVKDQISTAVYFLEEPHPVAVEQRGAATRLAATLEPESAFPFTVPRSGYALAAMALLAAALLTMRWWLEKPLRLEASLPELALRAIRGEDAAGQLAEQQPREQAQKNEGANGADEQAAQRRAGDGRPEETTNGPAEGDQRQRDPAAKGEGLTPGDEWGDPLPSDAGEEPIQSYEDMLERDARKGLPKAPGKDDANGAKDGPEKEANAGSDDPNSLMNKLRDALSKMLGKLGQKSQGEGKQQSAAAAAGDAAEKGEPNGDGNPGEGQPQGDGKDGAESGQSGEASNKAGGQQSDGQNAGKSGEGGSDADKGQGAGNTEGDKRLREARQLEALGKLSELYGRRLAAMSGEITVETQPGPQTLRTPLEQRQARHADSGGEVSRDQIPLAYQSYVKEYFEKVRQASKKQAP